MKKFLFLIITVLNSALANAGESSGHVLYGVSKDGKYAALEEYGVYDGSGFAFASLTIINVDSNTYATPMIYTIDENPDYRVGEQGTNKVRLANFKKAQKQIKQFGIVEQSKLGSGMLKHVVARSPYEAHEDVNAVSFSNRDLFLEYTHYMNRYEILLSTHTLPCSPDNAFCDESGDQQGLKLELKSCVDHGQSCSSKVLQEDTRIPSSRAYTWGYSIAGAYVFDPSATQESSAFNPAKSKIIVLLAVRSQGFEGPSLSYMLVSGKLE